MDEKQNTDPMKDFKTVLGMVVVLVVPAALTLWTVKAPGTFHVDFSTDPTPLGYTWSLLLFIIPSVVIAWWFFREPEYEIQKRSFWWALAILVGLGFLLDLAFALVFFKFPNPKATLEIMFWGLDLRTFDLQKEIPLEEFVFYFTGITSTLLIYLWCDEYWLRAYNVPDYGCEAEKITKVAEFRYRYALIGIGLILLAWLYKSFVAQGAYRGGFPGYFAFEITVSFIPCCIFLRTVMPFVNWRALSLTYLYLLLTSMLWEATVAIPYGWWGYQEAQMVGLIIPAWHDLPAEEPMLWMSVTFTTVIFYEVIKIVLHMKMPALMALIGITKTDLLAWLKKEKRLTFVVATLLFAGAADFLCAVFHLGWVAATLLTIVLIAAIVVFTWYHRDRLFLQLLIFGLVVGFAELPTDHLAVVGQKTLVYPQEGPFIWSSPLYMPFAYIIIMVQLGYLGYWATRKWGLRVASIGIAVFGAINVPGYELLAKYADFWYYENCRMLLGAVPYYTIASELVFALALPPIVSLFDKAKWWLIVLLGLLEGVVMLLASLITFKILG